MNDIEAIKDYLMRLLVIMNKVQLLGNTFPNSCIVEKILVFVPKRYKAAITIVENT
jgi:hypothetical protein